MEKSKESPPASCLKCKKGVEVYSSERVNWVACYWCDWIQWNKE